MSCKPTYKGVRYNSLDELYKVNGINQQQKQQALQLYSQYLDTIFPDSKVKDIVYHGSNVKFEKFSKDAFYTGDGRRRLGDGFYFNRIKTLDYGKNIYPAVLNITEFGNSKSIIDLEDEIKDLYIESSFEDTYGLYDEEYVINKKRELNRIYQPKIDELTRQLNKLKKHQNKFGIEDVERKDILVEEPEQIHILGNNQDIEGFKQFVDNNKNNLEMSEKSSNFAVSTYNEIQTKWEESGRTKEEWDLMTNEERNHVIKNCL